MIAIINENNKVNNRQKLEYYAVSTPIKTNK